MNFDKGAYNTILQNEIEKQSIIIQGSLSYIYIYTVFVYMCM